MSTLLNDIRVVDIAGHLAESAGRVLADLGAEVIKVEPPQGCDSRRRGPFADSGGESLHWQAWGRGKRSVVVDTSAYEGRAALRALVSSADILIDSAGPGELEAMGLDPGRLAEECPGLIHVSVTPFGLSGPRAGQPATDMTLSAAGGFLNHQGDKDRPPIPIGFAETSNHGAVQAAADALVALRERDRSGLGQRLDASMQAAVVGTLLWTSSYAVIDKNPGFTADDRAQGTSDRGGEVVPGVRNLVLEACADGWVVLIFVLGEQGNNAFAGVMRWIEEDGFLADDLCGRGWVDWIAEMRSGELPVSDGRRAIETVVEWLKTKTKAELMERSLRDKLLIAPCNTAADLLADPQLAARDFWADVGGVLHPGPFVQMSETPMTLEAPAPALGAHQHLLDTLSTPPTTLPGDSGQAHDSEKAPDTVKAADSGSAADAGKATAGRAPATARSPAFEGLKVADLTWMAAGPLITRELANHGATVVHAETMTRVDTMRWLPPHQDESFGPDSGLPAANANQSKLGLACNFAVPEARTVIERLIRWADVVVENFRPGMAARHGFDWPSVQRLNPKAVMMSTSMRGQTGPESSFTGFGLQGAALGGYVAITGWPDRSPIAPWGAYTDFVSPRFALAALVAAIRERDRSGRGQYLDLSQNEAGMQFLAPMILDYTVNGRVMQRPGCSGEPGAPSGVFRGAGAERFVVVSAIDDSHWDAARRVAAPLAEARFDGLDGAARLERRAEIEDAFAVWAAERDVFATADELMDAGCPAYVSLRATDLIRDQQLEHRGFFTALPHKVIEARFDGPVTLFSATPSAPWAAGPTVGEHTTEIMRDHLGFGEDEISDLAVAGVLS